MSDSKKTEEDVNEEFWITLQGIIDPVNSIADANDKDTIEAPAPVGRITEQVVRNVEQDVKTIAMDLDAGVARDLRQYVQQLDDLQDEVKQFNANTQVYMENVNYDRDGVEEL